MKLKDLLRVLNKNNVLVFYERANIWNDYELIYKGGEITKEEEKRLIKRYGKREVVEIDTSQVEGHLIFIELKNEKIV